MNKQRTGGVAIDAITLAYLCQMLAGVLLDDPGSWASHLLVSACIAANVAGLLVDRREQAMKAHERLASPQLAAIVHGSAVTLAAVLGVSFLLGPATVPGALFGIPVALFFLPGFVLSLVTAGMLARAIPRLARASQAISARGHPTVQNTLKCSADARSMRPS